MHSPSIEKGLSTECQMFTFGRTYLIICFIVLWFFLTYPQLWSICSANHPCASLPAKPVMATSPMIAALLTSATFVCGGKGTALHGPDDFTLAAMGDFLGQVVPSNNTRVTAAWDLIRQADFSFFNMEGDLFDIGTFTGYPASENGKESDYGNIGGGAQYEASQAAALAAAGFNLASHANNHGFDWLEAGMFATQKNLHEAGIAVAGGGDSLSSARAAVFLTKGNNTIGLVAAAGTHLPEAVAGAGDDSEQIKPRPGLSVLRAAPITLVSWEQFDSIKAIAEAQGQQIASDATEVSLHAGQFPYQFSTWRLSPDNNQGLVHDINEDDYDGILTSIRAARQKTRHVFFSFHGHESFWGRLTLLSLSKTRLWSQPTTYRISAAQQSTPGRLVFSCTAHTTYAPSKCTRASPSSTASQA